MATAAAAVKLSPALKALIAAPHALGSAIPAPPRVALTSLFDGIRQTSESKGAGAETWLTASTAALVTVNSPDTLCELYKYAAEKRSGVEDKVRAAAVIREVGLKCISFSGIPRTINALTALRTSLPPDVISGLSTSPTRLPTTANLEESQKRGRSLWDSIYEPHSAKLLNKLGDAHPDMPVHILNSHYAPLLSDPFTTSPAGGFKIGRILTSVVAIACLRAQQGVAPQLTSHVFGLKKALLDGGGAQGEEVIRGQDWLTSDEGVTWIIESTDEISRIIGEGRTTFAGPMKAKL